MNAKLVELLQTPVPNILWHYTDMTALKNIVATAKMRATDVRYMNDTEEFIHAQKIVSKQLDTLNEEGDMAWVKQKAKEMFENFCKTGSLSESSMQCFVVSFTTLGDSLSQWDRYADLSRGASLGFDLTNIRPPSDIDTLLTFAPCVYVDSVKEELVSATLQDFTKTLHQLWISASDETHMRERMILWQEEATSPNQAKDMEAFKLWNNVYYQQGVRECTTRFVAELLRLCALCKHSGFKEESEWRLVLPINPKRELVNATRRVRLRNGQEVPYIEIKLSFNEMPDLPLTQVMLGPCYKEPVPVIERDVTSERIPVSRSEIPYSRFNYALPCVSAGRATESQ